MARNHNVVQRSYGRNPRDGGSSGDPSGEVDEDSNDETDSDDDEIPLDHKGKGRRPAGPSKKV